MAFRTCETCGKGENPIGKLRFKKHVDGEVYCENCIPASVKDVAEGTSSATLADFGRASTSAGSSLVVIPCPDCRGMSNKPHGKQCECCSGYGSVRIPANFLNVYRPQVPVPEILEG
jgi:hypothetical protein